MALSKCNSIADLHGHEITKHGTLLFPIACYWEEMDVVRVPWHWHEEFEFAVVMEGECTFGFTNKKERMKKGDAIFINREILHCVVEEESRTAKLHTACYHSRLISNGKDTIFWEQLIKPFVPASFNARQTVPPYIVLRGENEWERQVIDHLLSAWQEVADEMDHYEIEVRHHLSLAHSLLIKYCIEDTSHMSQQELIDSARMRSMLDYIHNNYRDEISMKEIAAEAKVSATSCLKIFHDIIGTTPIQYVKRLRLEKAEELLKTTKQSATEIAFFCGFNDVSYFTRAFREKTGMTPKEYQMQYKNKKN